MAEAKDRILAHILKAFIWSMAGIKAAWKNEQAFRWEAAIVLLMMPIGLWLGKTAVERALLIACSMSVLIIELLNSAVEAVVNRIGPERHDLSKRAKDMGSAAALISMITAAVVWVLIAYERLLG
ncbi:MAG: diacylglycerol kinase [Desulfobacterales bacterium]|jgi:diacylglycerol kinase (ATP)